ncbi:CNPY2-like protein [Mya arenaria]|uniref:CNPY2-like protein n=1 Tax=Mya arenaria TaxID=6604 RepID=A0ABY7DRN5_MYAAR|nr:protein canopy homolog 2-like [Mya arenaria]WAR00358.1 CNPY2-like protein [Mya arenaria]
MDVQVISLFLKVLLLVGSVLGLDKQMSCAVCRAMVDEVSYTISKVDPKQTIQVGSFRVDSRGNQDTYKKPYARSEAHLLEIFESLCERFKDYAETTNDIDERSVCRTKAREGKTLALKDIKINPEVQASLRGKCDALLEELEDDMIALFGKANIPDYEKSVCVELAGECTLEALAVPMPRSEFSGMDDIMADVESTHGDGQKMPERDGEEKEDDELLDEYLQEAKKSGDEILAKMRDEEGKDEL